MKLNQIKVHFIGIGGIGMSGIAEVLLNMGTKVSGSDLSSNAQVERLQSLGAQIKTGHRAENIPDDVDVIVFSSAVKMDNAEMVEGRRRRIPIIPRAEMLAELMRLKRGIAVAGSHGKTTTTSLLASIMLAAHMDPTIVVGGRLDLIKSTAALGKGEWLLAEADESDGSFLRLAPEHVVITNIDNDHLDYFKTFENLKKAFLDFAERVPFYGSSVLCVDDPYVRELSNHYKKPQIRYGLNGEADLTAKNIEFKDGIQSFEVIYEGKSLGRASIHYPGRHNVLNSLAAIGIGLQLQLTKEIIFQGLDRFKGVDRRLQLKGQFRGVPVIDDYGHHPTEILATLSSLKQAYPQKRLVVVFQPHRFSRTQHCWNQFLDCFVDASELVLLDVYAAGEKPIPGISAVDLAKQVKISKEQVHYIGDRLKALDFLKGFLKEGDVLVTLGAGDVSRIGGELLG